MTSMIGARTGLYGKVPGKGDFVSRRLSKTMIEPWDSWLRQAFAASQQRLGETWLDRYLECPIWRFALSAGLCGPHSIIGILMPSVDSVSRYFPLTLAIPVASPAGAAVAGREWFGSAERLALESLSNDRDFEAWDQRVEALEPPPLVERARGDLGASDRSIHVPLPDGDNPGAAYPGLLDWALGANLPGYSLWWTVGSDRVSASLLLSRGLPEPEAYVGLLSAGWG